MAPISLLLLPPPGQAEGQTPTDAGYTAVRRGPDDRVWAKVSWQTNSSGVPIAGTNSAFVEVGTGLHFFSDGEWRASRDLVELAADGKSAAALYGQHKVHFSADAAITITTKSNRVFQTHPVGIYYSQSGRLVLLSAVNKSATAELHPPNQIVYRSAFDSDAVKADLRLTYTKAGLESDVIFTRKPKPPSAFGLEDAATAVEVHHAWLNAPKPRTITPKVLASGMVDETLDFGDLWFPLGRAFIADAARTREPSEPAAINLLPRPGESASVPVAKRWQEMGQGLALLIESVKWNSVAAELSRLPEIAQAESEAEEYEKTTEDSPARRRVELAGAPYKPTGFILDYITVSGSEGYTFSSGITYYLSSSGYFSGAVVFEPGCMLKSTSSLVCYGSISGGGWPCTLTAWNDDLYGEPIPGSDGCPDYISYGLVSYYLSYPVQIGGFRFRWANVALQIEGEYGGSVTDCQFELCRWGVYGSGCPYGGIYIDNVAMCGVDYPLEPMDCISGSATDICGGDGDSDGLPDVWEYRYFGNTYSQNGSGNPDGDELNNLQESQAGSNPTVYRAAIAGDQTVMTGIGEAVNITLPGSSQCNEPIVFTTQNAPQHGTLTGTGAVRTYTPSSTPPYEGWDSFTYTAGDSPQGTISLLVVPGPQDLIASCRPWWITVQWEIPQWVLPYVSEIVVKRAVAGGTYSIAKTIEVSNYAFWSEWRRYVDANVVSGTTYRYAVAFRYLEPSTLTWYESPASNEASTSTCAAFGCTVPSYQPEYWNNDPGTRGNNNCYNYANNVRTYTFAQPGRASGEYCESANCCTSQVIRQYALNDALLPTTRDAPPPDGMTKLALVIAPGWDYHWYRRDANALWTHKPGGTAATNLDNSGNVITDPETADRGPYTEFAGYFHTCSSSSQGQGHADIQ